MKPATDRFAKGLWWDRPWSLVDGCTAISEGCEHCWSRALAQRFRRDWTPRFRADRLDIPLRRRKPTVYAVWNDLFHPCVSVEDQGEVVEMMQRCPQHLFLILTKRPERICEFPRDEPLPNVALGVTVESQEHIGRVTDLLNAWHGRTFVSVEPMLGPVDFNLINAFGPCSGQCDHWRKGDHCDGRRQFVCHHRSGRKGVDLVICGGESGPGARPMHPDWARGLRDQCQAAGVPFFFKQWGEWLPLASADEASQYPNAAIHEWPDGTRAVRVGKRRAGRFLDGRTWDEFPGASET